VQYTTPTVHCTYSVPYRTYITLYAQYTVSLCGTTPFRLVLTTDIQTRLQPPYSERNVSPCRWRQQAVTSRQHEEQCQWQALSCFHLQGARRWRCKRYRFLRSSGAYLQLARRHKPETPTGKLVLKITEIWPFETAVQIISNPGTAAAPPYPQSTL